MGERTYYDGRQIKSRRVAHKVLGKGPSQRDGQGQLHEGTKKRRNELAIDTPSNEMETANEPDLESDSLVLAFV